MIELCELKYKNTLLPLKKCNILHFFKGKSVEINILSNENEFQPNDELILYFDVLLKIVHKNKLRPSFKLATNLSNFTPQKDTYYAATSFAKYPHHRTQSTVN